MIRIGLFLAGAIVLGLWVYGKIGGCTCKDH